MPSREPRRRSDLRRAARLAVALGVVVIAGLGFYAFRVSRTDRDRQNLDLGMRVSVLPFETSDSVPIGLDARALADAVAARLARVPGLDVIVGTHGPKDVSLVLRGSIRVRGERLVVSARLSSSGAQDTLWSATFWRARGTGEEIVPDLAAAVAGAVGEISARRSLDTTRRIP